MKRPHPAPEPSASVYVQPAPHGHWSANNNFCFEIPFGPAVGNRERIINLPEWGEPVVWTVSLGIDYGLLIEGATFVSEDHREASVAFVEKRAAVFRGR